MNIVNVFLQLLSVSYRIENNHIVSLRIDTYRIVWWPYRLIPNRYRQVRQSSSLQVCKFVNCMSIQGKSIHAALSLMQYTITLNPINQSLIRHARMIIDHAFYQVLVIIMRWSVSYGILIRTKVYIFSLYMLRY